MCHVHVCLTCAGKPKPTWQVQQAHHVVQQLQGKQGNFKTIGHAVAAVAQDVQPGHVEDASFIKAAAEGVLFEGLASLLRQVAVVTAVVIVLLVCICGLWKRCMLCSLICCNRWVLAIVLCRC